jgi:hypothetical protein
MEKNTTSEPNMTQNIEQSQDEDSKSVTGIKDRKKFL